MMPGVLRCAAIVACAVTLAAVSGCASAPTRFYALSAVPPGAGPTSGLARSGPALGVGPVSVPERLNRPEIVTWANESMLHLAEFDQWAAPLQDSVSDDGDISDITLTHSRFLLSFDRLLKSIHLLRFPHPSLFNVRSKIRLTPQDFGGLASGRF